MVCFFLEFGFEDGKLKAKKMNRSKGDGQLSKKNFCLMSEEENVRAYREIWRA